MYACMYVCMHVCMHACLYACMYACMHIHIHIAWYTCNTIYNVSVFVHTNHTKGNVSLGHVYVSNAWSWDSKAKTSCDLTHFWNLQGPSGETVHVFHGTVMNSLSIGLRNKTTKAEEPIMVEYKEHHVWYIPSGKLKYVPWKSIMWNGKLHYFNWAIFHSKLLQSLPEGIIH